MDYIYREVLKASIWPVGRTSNTGSSLRAMDEVTLRHQSLQKVHFSVSSARDWLRLHSLRQAPDQSFLVVFFVEYDLQPLDEFANGLLKEFSTRLNRSELSR